MDISELTSIIRPGHIGLQAPPDNAEGIVSTTEATCSVDRYAFCQERMARGWELGH